MSLEDRIKSDMQSALRNKQKKELETLRTIIAKIKDERIKLMRDLEDGDVEAVLRKALKSRKESIDMFRKGNRPDLVDSEQKEAEIIKKYLPEQLSEQEITSVLVEIINNVSAHSERDIGKVMGPAMKRFQGRADGKQVQMVLRKLLQSTS
jgi:uncharacterized protein YqeY